MKFFGNRSGADTQAAAWFVRLREPGASAEDWDEFTKWLEASPANRDSYRTVSLADDLVEDSSPPLRQISGYRSAYKGWITLAVAASVAAVVAIPLTIREHSPVVIEATSGEQRSLTVADGTRVHLNGPTRLELSRGDQRQVRLTYGEALFDVHHDESRPFVVFAGGLELVDAGTRFNVRVRPAQIDVAVAEGAVIVNPDTQSVELLPGQGLTATAGRWVMTQVAPQSVGDWRARELIYEGASLARVAADLESVLGRPVELAPSAKGRTFTGSLFIEPDNPQSLSDVAAAIGVRVTRRPDGSILLS